MLDVPAASPQYRVAACEDSPPWRHTSDAANTCGPSSSGGSHGDFNMLWEDSMATLEVCPYDE